MFRNTFKYFFMMVFCIFFVSSCSFLSENTGAIEFTLPNVKMNYKVGADEAVGGSEYRVLVQSKKGHAIYDKKHDAGSDVVIPDVPVGYYEVFVSRETESYVIKGEADVVVSYGQESFVKIQLKKYTKPGAIKLVMTGDVVPVADAKFNVEVCTSAGKSLFSVAGVGAGQFPYIIENLPVGTGYSVNISGESAKFKYSLARELSGVEVKAGKTGEVSFALKQIDNGEPEPVDPPAGPTETFYVDGSVSDDTGDGTESGKLKTIQAALDKILEKNNTNSSPVTYVVDVTGDGGAVSINNNTNKELKLKIQNGACSNITINGTKKVDLELSNCVAASNGNSSIGSGCNLTLTGSSLLTGSSGTAITVSGNGTLTIGGNAKVTSSSSGQSAILLSGNASRVVVNSKLTGSGTVAIIKKDSYSAGTEVVHNGGFDIAGRFGVPSGVNFEIDAEGKLAAVSNPVPDAGTGTAVGSFGELKAAVGTGGNIKLTQGFEITETLTVANNVTITADSAVTLTRGSALKDALFQVNDGGALTIQGGSTGSKIVLDGNNVVCSKPLVISYGNLDIENCSLKNNKTTESSTITTKEVHTGALYIGKNEQKNQVVNIINTDITNNEGFSNDAGIITIEQDNNSKGTVVTFTGCDISNNTAAEGAFSIIGISNKKPVVNIISTTINNNISTKNGGGINTKYSTITLDSTTMDGNKAKTSGGGIYMNNGANITIKNTTEIRNGVVNHNGGSGGKGANVFVQNATGSTLGIEKNGQVENITIKANFAIDDTFNINWIAPLP